MCYDYSAWMHRQADKSKEQALKTLDRIFDEADKDGLTSDALDDMKDCWTILAMIEGYEHSHANGEPESAADIAARVTGQNVK